MIYIYCMPRCRRDYEGAQLEGCVVIPAATVDDRFEENRSHFLDILDSETPAFRVPSESECRFCEITSADCPERIETGALISSEDLP